MCRGPKHFPFCLSFSTNIAEVNESATILKGKRLNDDMDEACRIHRKWFPSGAKCEGTRTIQAVRKNWFFRRADRGIRGNRRQKRFTCEFSFTMKRTWSFLLSTPIKCSFSSQLLLKPSYCAKKMHFILFMHCYRAAHWIIPQLRPTGNPVQRELSKSGKLLLSQRRHWEVIEQQQQQKMEFLSTILPYYEVTLLHKHCGAYYRRKFRGLK